MTDAKKPGDYRRAPIVIAVDRFPGFEEGLSGEVFSLTRIVDQVVDVAVDAHDILVVELRESLGVALDRSCREHTLEVLGGQLPLTV